MELFSRYLKNGLRGYVKGSGNWIFVGLCAVVSAIIFCRNGITFQNILTGVLIGAAFAVVFLLLYLIISSAVSASQNAEFNAYGFTREKVEKYKQRLEAGKKFKTFDWLLYAEAHMRIGETQEALDILKDLTVEPDSEPHIQAAYHFLCIMSYLRAGNIPEAEKAAADQRLVELCKTDKRYFYHSTRVNLPLIMIDLYKGQTDPDSLQAGCDRLSEFQRSEVFEKNTTPDILILCLYALKTVGNDKEFKEFYPWLKNELTNNYRPPWDFMYDYYLAEFKKAADGKLPFLD